MSGQLYFQVSGESSCSKRDVIYPATDEDSAVRLYAAEFPRTNRILSVERSSKIYYDAQESAKDNQRKLASDKMRWNQILKEVKNAN